MWVYGVVSFYSGLVYLFMVQCFISVQLINYLSFLQVGISDFLQFEDYRLHFLQRLNMKYSGLNITLRRARKHYIQNLVARILEFGKHGCGR